MINLNPIEQQEKKHGLKWWKSIFVFVMKIIGDHNNWTFFEIVYILIVQHGYFLQTFLERSAFAPIGITGRAECFQFSCSKRVHRICVWSVCEWFAHVGLARFVVIVSSLSSSSLLSFLCSSDISRRNYEVFETGLLNPSIRVNTLPPIVRTHSLRLSPPHLPSQPLCYTCSKQVI